MNKVLVPHEYNLIINSDPSTGASNVNSLGSYFEVNLEEVIKLPSNAHNPQLTVESADIWWVVPNIITGVNDKLYITGPDNSDVIQNFVITLPKGLYNLADLEQAVVRLLDDQDAKNIAGSLISFEADDATQKIIMKVNYTNTSVDFTQSDTFRDILGFNSGVYGPYLVITNVYAQNVANFNTVNHFLINSDLVSKGIQFNNRLSQVIAKVQINVPPGEQILYAPYNPTKIGMDHLLGSSKKLLRFWLTDQNGNLVDTNTEYWSALLKISYLTEA